MDTAGIPFFIKIHAYKNEFYEEASDQDENHWSKKLAACIPDKIYSKQWDDNVSTITFYKYHGVPDLVIKDTSNSTCTPIVSNTGYQESSSQDDDDYVRKETC